jgi:predicted KAP-like P-loop ATPase
MLNRDCPKERYDDLDTSQQSVVDRICECIHEAAVDGNGSVVFGIEGAWGAGKSSILNGIIEILDRSISPKWMIGKYNAWDASSAQKLQSDILMAIARNGKLVGHMKRFLKAVSIEVSSSPFSFSAKPFSLKVGPLKINYESAISEQERIRKRLVHKLNRLKNSPILIAIDDADRIDKSELSVLYKTIRNIGNLPNVYYLLAYDKIAADTLIEDAGFCDKSNQFIEKIVQYPFCAPKQNQYQAAAIIRDAVEVALSCKLGIGDSYKLPNLLPVQIQTYRGLYRLKAELSVYSDMQTSIYPFDLILVLILKNYHRPIFEQLYSKFFCLTGLELKDYSKQQPVASLGEAFEVSNAISSQERSQEIKSATISELISLVPTQQRNCAEQIIKYLFSYHISNEDKCPQEYLDKQRFSCPEYFSRYINLTRLTDTINKRTDSASRTDMKVNK